MQVNTAFRRVEGYLLFNKCLTLSCLGAILGGLYYEG